MKNFLLFITFIFFALNTHAIDLNWRSIPIQSIDYDRSAVPGGGALYSIPSETSLKFNVQFVFLASEFSFSEKEITTYSAMADLLLLGGFGQKNYAQIEKELNQNGISLSTSVNSLGQLTITCEALKDDFTKVMKILNDLILNPRFDPQALVLWKQQARNNYNRFINANTFAIQMQFVDAEASKLAFGKDHYLAQTIKRASPSYTNAVKLTDIKNLYDSAKNRNGLQIMLSGSYPSDAKTQLQNLIKKIPSKEIPIIKWLPNRLKDSNQKIKMAIIQKPDMTQSQISFRLYYSELGELNPIEKVQIAILSDIYSSTGGVVGNDRFSKALRADSGISYSPRASFVSDMIAPNTNVGAFIMNFQSPNERLAEAIKIAKNTWETFINKGITQSELINTRSSMMNSMLATELTVFDKANMVFSKILSGRIPSVNPIQQTLESLEAQKNVHDLNRFIKTKLASQSVGVLIIMGNPSKSEINQLKSIPQIDLVEITTLNSFK